MNSPTKSYQVIYSKLCLKIFYIYFFLDLLKGSFSASFHHPDIAPLKRVGHYNIMELWHGATGAFKDLAFVPFARFIDHFLRKRNKKGIALIGTLGDTGCAAISAFKELENTKVICLYPKYSVSKLQRLQMTTVKSPNILNISCETDTDNFDGIIVKLMRDREIASKYNLLWVNSPNVGRIVCHTVHHIYTYLQLCPSCDKTVTFYIPSGALADSASAYQTSLMGVPINVVSTVNENDFFFRLFNEKRLSRPLSVVKTYSCAMDTVFPHNVERILYLLSGRDGPLINSIMKEYYTNGCVAIPQSILDAASTGTSRIRSVRVGQDEGFAVAKRIWEEEGYQLCPHTAVALAGQDKDSSEAAAISICLATATAAKFQEFLHHLSIPVPVHPCVEGLEGKEEIYREMKKGEDWEQLLMKAINDMHEL